MDYNPDSVDAKLALLLKDMEDRTIFRKEIITRLDKIEAQCRLTNGRITKLETERNELGEDVKELVGLKRFAGRYLFSKWTLLGLGALGLGIVKIASDPALLELAFKIIGI